MEDIKKCDMISISLLFWFYFRFKKLVGLLIQTIYTDNHRKAEYKRNSNKKALKNGYFKEGFTCENIF